LSQLNLQRPLVVFDLETTGTDVKTDRIVEVSALRIEPDGTREQKTRRVNPGRPIPAGATAVHGISDDDVRDQPAFAKIARGLLTFFENADLAGFNVGRFDIPLLERELKECGLDLERGKRRILDAMTIYHRKERRDLSAAVRFYLDREHEGAHSAEADVANTFDVLEAQLARYEELPRDVEALDAWCNPVSADAVDREGKFVWRNSQVVFAFGKHQGKTLQQVVGEAPDYLRWVAGSDFPEEARRIVQQALDGEYPQPS